MVLLHLCAATKCLTGQRFAPRVSPSTKKKIMQTPPVPVPSGLYETHLTVANLETSVAFYRDIVGLELATTMADRGIAFFWVGGKKNGMLGLWQTGGGPLGMRLHFAFQTPLEQVFDLGKFLFKERMA